MHSLQWYAGFKRVCAAQHGILMRCDICCRVATPRNLTQRQRELLEEFSAAGDEQRAKAG